MTKTSADGKTLKLVVRIKDIVALVAALMAKIVRSFRTSSTGMAGPSIPMMIHTSKLSTFGTV